MSTGIVHFEIPADDPGELSKFYQDVFGWQTQKWDMPGGEYWLVSTVKTNERGMPQQPGAINGAIAKRQAPNQTLINYISVPSVDEYMQKVQSQGGKSIHAKIAVPQMGISACLPIRKATC